jgi:hypothetical protein
MQRAGAPLGPRPQARRGQRGAVRRWRPRRGGGRRPARGRAAMAKRHSAPVAHANSGAGSFSRPRRASLERPATPGRRCAAIESPAARRPRTGPLQPGTRPTSEVPVDGNGVPIENGNEVVGTLQAPDHELAVAQVPSGSWSHHNLLFHVGTRSVSGSKTAGRRRGTRRCDQ